MHGWLFYKQYAAIDVYKRQIPRDYEEAAMIDGCGPVGILRHVIVPMAKPGICLLYTSIAFMKQVDNTLLMNPMTPTR